MLKRFIVGAALAVSPPRVRTAISSKPVTMIVPWPAGGSTDIAMRALAEATGKQLGQPVIVENKPGAGGTLGAVAMTTAKPDGHTSRRFRSRCFVCHISRRPPLIRSPI